MLHTGPFTVRTPHTRHTTHTGQERCAAWAEHKPTSYLRETWPKILTVGLFEARCNRSCYTMFMGHRPADPSPLAAASEPPMGLAALSSLGLR